MPMTLAAGMNFDDVKPDAWYYNDVKTAVESGLVNGKSKTSYRGSSSDDR